jgi:hypothetical protein
VCERPIVSGRNSDHYRNRSNLLLKCRSQNGYSHAYLDETIPK